MFKHKNTFRLTIYAVILIMAAVTLSYILLFSEFREHLDEASMQKLTGKFLIILFASAVLAFFVSSLIIDQVLNPVREMTRKVVSIGNRDFSEKLPIDSDDLELREYAVVFNEMVDKLDTYIEAQKHFISDASHELATPLTIVLGIADQLQRWSKYDEAKLTAGLDAIVKESRRMNNLVNVLLFFARSDGGTQPYQFQDGTIAKFLEETLSSYELLYPDFVFNLQIKSDPVVTFDAASIERVFHILLDNAVKYDTIQCCINIILDQNNNYAMIEFKDHGPGFPDSDLDKIFNRFYRSDDSRTRQTGGTGLGLAIAKEIAAAHKGSIMAENNSGAQVTLQLPLASSNLHNKHLTSS